MSIKGIGVGSLKNSFLKGVVSRNKLYILLVVFKNLNFGYQISYYKTNLVWKFNQKIDNQRVLLF